MATTESTEVRAGAFPQAEGRAETRSLPPGWERLKLVATRSMFWSYERGSWQYDVIVLVLLAFIFLTPRSWFSDRPTLQLTDLRRHQGVVEIGHAKDEWRYLIDSRLVESHAPLGPEDAIREILRRRLQKPFAIKSFEVVRDKNNVVLGYSVLVAR